MTDPESPEQLESQAERTALAWSRTLIGLAGVTGFLAVHAALGASLPASVVLGVIAAVILVCSSPVSRRTWAMTSAALAGDRPASRPVPVAVLSAVTVILATAAIVLVFLDWR